MCPYKLQPFPYESHKNEMLRSRLKWNVAEPSEKKQNIVRKKNQLFAEQPAEIVSNGDGVNYSIPIGPACPAAELGNCDQSSN